MRRAAWTVGLVVWLAACGGDDEGGDPDLGPRADGGTRDSGRDAGPAGDAGADAGSVDAGDPADASLDGETDAGETDAGETDAGETDAGETDAGVDPCDLVPEEMRCDLEGALCAGDTLTVCAPDPAGCVVATATDCAATGETCGETPAGELGCIPPPCGDGDLDGGESCDDGDTTSGDGCSATCTTEPGFACSGTPSVCVPATGNGTCAGALALGGTTVADVTTGGARPTGAVCGSGTGPALYYSVTVPARTQLHATATPSAAWDATLHVLLDCAAAGCLSSSDTGGTMPGTERVTITNETDAPLTRIVSVAAAGATGGPLTLSITTSEIPYVRVAAACEVSPGAPTTHITPGPDDDIVTPFAPLPFSIPFFGVTQTHFAVSTNGLLQLWSSAGGAPESTGANVTIPTGPLPNSMVAAFWDDLAVNPTGSVRSWTAGAAPNRRFIMEWNDMGFYGLPGATLRFQAHLHESSGVIEVHYCALEGTLLVVHGVGATIGLEDATGVTGRLVSFNTRDVVSTGDGIRFTP